MTGRDGPHLPAAHEFLERRGDTVGSNSEVTKDRPNRTVLEEPRQRHSTTLRVVRVPAEALGLSSGVGFESLRKRLHLVHLLRDIAVALPAGVLERIVQVLARGLTNREIAGDLAISIKTVDTQRGHVLKKLQLRNNSELTRFAVKHGYVSL